MRLLTIVLSLGLSLTAAHGQDAAPAVTADAYIDRQLENMAAMTEAMTSEGPEAAGEVWRADAPELKAMWDELQAAGVDVGAASRARLDEINTVRMDFTDAMVTTSLKDPEGFQAFMKGLEGVELVDFGL